MAPNDDEERRAAGLADAAGRAAFLPARAAARAWRGRFEQAADEVLSAPEIARVVDRALAGSLPEEIARSLARHGVIERIADELIASGELERLVTAALGSSKTLELTDRVLASDETQHALRHVASSPELRDAIGQQTKGLTDEVVGGIRASAARLDDRAEQVVRRPPRTVRPNYGGIATRAIALAIDAALTIVIFMSVVGVTALVASLVGGLRPAWLVGALLASGWMLIVGTYFVLFWSAAGQTPGMRLLRVRVQGTTGQHPLGRSIARAPGRARARDRADVRGLRPRPVHPAATRPTGFPRGNRRPPRRLARVTTPGSSQCCGVNGRSSSTPGWMMPTCDSGTAFHAPSRSPSGSETTTRVSSDSPASSAMSG